jgi:putative peptidoglycan lipid II flippase
MIQQLPAALISQAIAQSLLPHLTVQAASGRYVRMRQTALRVMGGAVALTVPAAIVLAILGKPVIHLLFQHGAFNQHSTDITSLALIGYAIALPGMSAGSLIAGGFFALKDSITPFLVNTIGLAVHYAVLMLLFHILPVPLMVLSIPLALGGSTSVESLLLIGMLLVRLRGRARLDKGMMRLLQRRQYEQERKQVSALVSHGSVAES